MITQLLQGFVQLSDLLSTVIFYPISCFGITFPWIVLLFIVTGIYLTFYFKFVNITGLLPAFRLLRQRSLAGSDTPGDVSHFQALATALSGTVGLGSIGGVAVAIAVGGPGTLIWMVVAGFLAMPIKMTECTLGLLYRRTLGGGQVAGGPMYFLESAFAEICWPRLGRSLGVLYAMGILFCAFGIGATFQSNQIIHQMAFVMFRQREPDSFLLIGGILLAVVISMVILGGIKSIARVAEKLVPFMIAFYLLTAFLIIGLHWRSLPDVAALIWKSAWDWSSFSGGALGVIVIGFQRAIFTNEAGVGSASIAHSAARTATPIEQGLLSLLEPFLATVIVCSTTALLIMVTLVLPGHPLPTGAGVRLTSEAFAQYYPLLLYPLSLVIFLFGFTTILAWAYYGQIGVQYLLGGNQSRWLRGYQLFFCAMVAVGGLLSLESILQFSDALLFLIALPNLVGCLWFAHRLKPLLAQKLGHGNKARIITNSMVS